MRSHFRRLTLLIVFTLFSSCIAAHAAGYWPAEVSEDQIRSVEWRFDPADLRVEGMGDLTVLSVSPSGQYIAAADRSRHSPEHKNAADVANPLGRLPDAVCLFSRQDGHYRLDKTIPVDAETQLELSSLLGGAASSPGAKTRPAPSLRATGVRTAPPSLASIFIPTCICWRLPTGLFAN